MLQDKKFWAILDHQLFMQFNIYIMRECMNVCMLCMNRLFPMNRLVLSSLNNRTNIETTRSKVILSLKNCLPNQALTKI